MTMKKSLLIGILLLTACTTKPPITTQISPASSIYEIKANNQIPSPAPTNPPPESYTIPQKFHNFQTFNNCGPATLSMLLSYSNISISQNKLGTELRPYQNPGGDNDDKSVTMSELENYAKQKLQLIAYYRPNGTIDLLKSLISNGNPVVLRTWLNDKDDIGHFILLRGYNDTTQTFIVDDSYYGPDRIYSYTTILKRWQPFNYEYLVIAQTDQLLQQLLQKQTDQNTTWQNSLNRAISESEQDANNPYPFFNQSVAYYYLGDYQQSVRLYQQIQFQLPSRMLWYQLQPILAYQKIGDHKKVFELTSQILNNNNRAYSELYAIRASSYLQLGDKKSARHELELAVKYNTNNPEYSNLLDSL